MAPIAQPPLVSIGVPVYNGARFLRQTLDSLLGQSHRHIEIVVCDNASTDATAAICAEYAARDSRVKYARNDRNIGLAGNFRRVLELASGDYFTWAAADDVRPVTAIQEGLSGFQRNPAAVMAHGPVDLRVKTHDRLTRMSNEMNLSQSSAAERIRAFTRGLRHNGMLFGLYKRDAVKRATFGAHYGQDYLVCLKLCQLGPVEYVSSPLVVYRERGETLDTPMYRGLRLRVKDLLFYRGVRRRKCWVVLLCGCYYLGVDRDLPARDRVDAVRAHMTSFVGRYWIDLVRECVFVLCTPLMWILSPVAPAAVRLVGALRRWRDRDRRVRSVS